MTISIKLIIIAVSAALFLGCVAIVFAERAQDRAIELARCEAREDGYQSSIRDITRALDAEKIEGLRETVRDVAKEEVPNAEVDGDACAASRAPDALLRQLRDNAR